MALSIDVNTLFDTSIVILSGRLSADDRIDNRIQPVLESARVVIVDLSALHYVDAAGIGQLIMVYESARKAGRRLVLFKPDSRLKALLNIVNLTAVFEIDNGVPAALQGDRVWAPAIYFAELNNRSLKCAVTICR